MSSSLDKKGKLAQLFPNRRYGKVLKNCKCKTLSWGKKCYLYEQIKCVTGKAFNLN